MQKFGSGSKSSQNTTSRCRGKFQQSTRNRHMRLMTITKRTNLFENILTNLKQNVKKNLGLPSVGFYGPAQYSEDKGLKK